MITAELFLLPQSMAAKVAAVPATTWGKPQRSASRRPYPAIWRAAEQDQVAHRGRALIGPVLDVVAIGPLWRPVAVLRDTAPVPGRQRPPGGGRRRPAGPSNLRIELAFAEDPADGGIAGDPAQRLGGDDRVAVELTARCIGCPQPRVDR